jgi:TldD protein
MFQEIADFSIDYLEKKGVDYAEARAESGEFSSFTLRDGIPEVSSFGDSSGIGVRFSVKNNIGFVAINDFDKDKIRELLDKSLNLTIKSHKIAEKIKFSESKALKGNTKIIQRTDIRDVDPSYKFKLVNDLNKNLESDHKYFSLSDGYVKKYYVNTEGSKIYSELPRISFFYFLTLKEKGNVIQRYLQHGGVGGYELFKKWELEKEINAELKALRENMKSGVKAPDEKIDVILAPEVVGIAVHESGGHPYEADRIFGREAAQAGESFIKKGMVGHKIANEQVNIVDDPTVKGSYGFYEYDDEGVKSRRKFMVKDGVITEFMHNRETAAKMNLESNGSARAKKFSYEPIIRMSNTLLLPGNYSEDEMIKDIKKGVYIKNFMEWNIDDMRFHQKYVGNEAYLIENGELTKPVKSPALEITTPVLWSSVDAVGNNSAAFAGNCGKGEPMQGIPVWMGGPSVRLRNIKLS